jgi:hypothetical protein
MEEMRNVYKILVEKTEGKRPLGRHRRRWEDNIRMHLRQMGCEGVDWRAPGNTVMNLRVP